MSVGSTHPALTSSPDRRQTWLPPKYHRSLQTLNSPSPSTSASFVARILLRVWMLRASRQPVRTAARSDAGQLKLLKEIEVPRQGGDHEYSTRTLRPRI